MFKIKLKGNFSEKRVWINNREIFPKKSLQIINHSPTGFNWGYGGSGSAQLSLAILLELTKKEIALKNYQKFKQEVVLQLPQDNFEKDIDMEEYIK